MSFDWERLQRLFEGHDPAAVTARWPTPIAKSFRDALTALQPDAVEEIWQLGRRREALERLGQHPIVAVAGMLNSGKTSLISSFLSDTGRRRALRGVRAAEGTQRFVLWLPEAWRRDPELSATLEAQLGDVFGGGIESLSNDPEIAHRQYSCVDDSRDLFDVPLVATDPALDALEFAFLDCPDIQRRHRDAKLGADDRENVRLSFLSRASALCSAFLVVATFESVEAHELEQVFEAFARQMPGVRRFLLLNKLRPEIPPHEALAEVGSLIETHRIQRCFGAYDFDLPSAAPFIPPARAVVQNGAESGGERDSVESFPRFYALASEASENPPQAIDDERHLRALGAHLPEAELFGDRIRASTVRFKKLAWDGLRAVEADAQRSTTRVDELQKGLLGVCCDLLLDEHRQLRVQPQPEMIAALLTGLERTAPWYVKPFMLANRPLQALRKAARTGVERVRELVEPQRRLETTLASVRGDGSMGAVIDGGALMMRIKGRDLDHEFDAARLEQDCARIVERFRDEYRAQVDGDSLEIAARDLWQRLSGWGKAKTAVVSIASLGLGLAAVCLVPFDFGHAIIYAASLQEIATAMGMSLVFTSAMEFSLRGELERQAGWPQFAHLHAVLCDQFGLPREPLTAEHWSVTHAGGEQNLPAPRADQPSAEGSTFRVWDVEPAFTRSLTRALKDDDAA